MKQEFWICLHTLLHKQGTSANTKCVSQPLNLPSGILQNWESRGQGWVGADHRLKSPKVEWTVQAVQGCKVLNATEPNDEHQPTRCVKQEKQKSKNLNLSNKKPFNRTQAQAGLGSGFNKSPSSVPKRKLIPNHMPRLNKTIHAEPGSNIDIANESGGKHQTIATRSSTISQVPTDDNCLVPSFLLFLDFLLPWRNIRKQAKWWDMHEKHFADKVLSFVWRTNDELKCCKVVFASHARTQKYIYNPKTLEEFLFRCACSRTLLTMQLQNLMCGVSWLKVNYSKGPQLPDLWIPVGIFRGVGDLRLNSSICAWPRNTYVVTYDLLSWLDRTIDGVRNKLKTWTTPRGDQKLLPFTLLRWVHHLAVYSPHMFNKQSASCGSIIICFKQRDTAVQAGAHIILAPQMHFSEVIFSPKNVPQNGFIHPSQICQLSLLWCQLTHYGDSDRRGQTESETCVFSMASNMPAFIPILVFPNLVPPSFKKKLRMFLSRRNSGNWLHASVTKVIVNTNHLSLTTRSHLVSSVICCRTTTNITLLLQLGRRSTFLEPNLKSPLRAWISHQTWSFLPKKICCVSLQVCLTEKKKVFEQKLFDAFSVDIHGYLGWRLLWVFGEKKQFQWQIPVTANFAGGGVNYGLKRQKSRRLFVLLDGFCFAFWMKLHRICNPHPHVLRHQPTCGFSQMRTGPMTFRVSWPPSSLCRTVHFLVTHHLHAVANQLSCRW